MSDPKTAAATVAANLRRARELADVSQVALAEKSGVGRTTIVEIEAGHRAANVDTLEALANALGVPLRSLFLES